MQKAKNLIFQFLATCGGVGYAPFASGTVATAVGLGIIYLLHPHPLWYLLVLALLLGWGVAAAGYMERLLKENDPGVVVIDEVVGVMIALFGLPATPALLICGFFLFRAFDVFKIYPIDRFERIPGGWGIMLDDVMAGLYTNIALNLAVHWKVL